MQGRKKVTEAGETYEGFIIYTFDQNHERDRDEMEGNRIISGIEMRWSEIVNMNKENEKCRNNFGGKK
jgi:hypothetical protein